MAQNRLKIAPILEAADLMEKPDSKCIQLYVSYLYEELKDYETSGTDAISGHNSLKSLVQLVMISRSLEGSNKLKEQAHTLIKKLREVKNSAENINLEDGLENVEVLHKLHDENELRIQDIESLRDEVESVRRDLKDPISKELWELFMLTAHVVESLQQRLGVLVLDKFQEVTKLWYNQIEIIGQKVEKLGTGRYFGLIFRKLMFLKSVNVATRELIKKRSLVRCLKRVQALPGVILHQPGLKTFRWKTAKFY